MITYDKKLAVEIAKNLGIVQPALTFEVSLATGLPYHISCGLLLKESYGGKNVWGGDGGPKGFMSGYGTVKKSDFILYRHHRRLGFQRQGAGPCQLTWWEFQDRADELGGCWVPRHNMTIGFGDLNQKRENGNSWRESFRQYNGSGDAAEDYADDLERRRLELRDLFEPARIAA